MVDRPDKLPEWASEDHTDPNAPVPNVVEPPTEKKQRGWFYKEYPPANWFNWLGRYVYRWLKFYDDRDKNHYPVYGVDNSATPNELTVTLDPAIDHYEDGRIFIVKVNNTNTGASTLKINGLPAYPIKDLDGKPLVADEIKQEVIYTFVYSSGSIVFGSQHFILQSKSPQTMGVTGEIKIGIMPSLDGYVLMDDGTIGSETSGATTRANADCEDLFKLLWDQISDTFAPVIGGRGASAQEDWDANKQITLTRQLGRAIAGRGKGDGLTPRLLGEYLGQETATITASQMPWHRHTQQIRWGISWTTTQEYAHEFNFGTNTGYTGPQGGDESHNNMQPTTFYNVFMKL